MDPEVLEHVLEAEALDKAVRNLNGGTSFDVLGWNHEALQTLHQHHPSGRIISRWLIALYTQPHMSLPWKLYVASKMVPSKKNMQGDCRPVAVPTAAHKVMAMLLMRALLPGGLPLFQEKQYGIKKRNGSAELARDVTRTMHAQPMHCVIQVDIANAFGSIQREEVHRSIEQIGHPAGHLASKWLWSEHSAAVALPGRELRHITSKVGVPQGDPLSALVFSLAYNGLVQRGLDHHALGQQDDRSEIGEQAKSWAYIDDLTLMCDPREAGAVLAALEQSLASGGLVLNRRKTQIYLPVGAPHPDQSDWIKLWQEMVAVQALFWLATQPRQKCPISRKQCQLERDHMLKPTSKSGMRISRVWRKTM